MKPYKVVQFNQSTRLGPRETLEDRLNELHEEGYRCQVTVLSYETSPNGQNHGHGVDVSARYLIICEARS